MIVWDSSGFHCICNCLGALVPLVWMWLQVVGATAGGSGAPLRLRGGSTTGVNSVRARNCRCGAQVAPAACLVRPRQSWFVNRAPRIHAHPLAQAAGPVNVVGGAGLSASSDGGRVSLSGGSGNRLGGSVTLSTGASTSTFTSSGNVIVRTANAYVRCAIAGMSMASLTSLDCLLSTVSRA